jgi:pimeloyl-ACP methyl ester carboxylesterase
MKAKNIIFRSGSLHLAGTLLLPDTMGPYPAVLLIAGSGQVDRDENAKKLHINALHDIAVSLAEHGFASLRYDKRGVGASEGDYWETGFYDNVADAQAALDYLKLVPEILPSQVFLLGHSEGAAIATHLASTGIDVTGVILLAGWARDGEDLLLWQAEQVIKGMNGPNKWLINLLHLDIRKMQQKQFEKIKRSKKTWSRKLTARINDKWLRETLAYDPTQDLPKIKVPILALTGSKDIQVDPTDLDRMAEFVQGDFEKQELPGITHILRTDPAEPALAHYKSLVAQPVDPHVLESISGWLKKEIVQNKN